MVTSNICLRTFLSGDTDLTANEAFSSWPESIGVVAPKKLEAETTETSPTVCVPTGSFNRGPAKHAVYASEHDTLERAVHTKSKPRCVVLESEDGREGVLAFLEKRPPRLPEMIL